MLDDLKGASAESQIQIARLTEDVAQAKVNKIYICAFIVLIVATAERNRSLNIYSSSFS